MSVISPTATTATPTTPTIAFAIEREASERRLAILGLTAIMVIGAAIRLWNINAVGLNSDEAVYSGQAAALAGDVGLQQFFAIFRQNVLEGLFADPLYGGNANLIGWKWIGFPGDPMAYGDPYGKLIDKFDTPYNVEPKPLQ